MLETLLINKIRDDDLSIRQAGKQIGIAHTTVIRLMEGGNCDQTTLVKVATWLNVEPSTLLDSEGKSDLANKIAVLLEQQPKLADLLGEVLDRVVRDEIKPEAFTEIISYITFRLQY